MPRAKRPDIAGEILRDLPEITTRVSYIDTLQIWLAAPRESGDRKARPTADERAFLELWDLPRKPERSTAKGAKAEKAS